jgi:hypothetical protein
MPSQIWQANVSIDTQGFSCNRVSRPGNWMGQTSIPSCIKAARQGKKAVAPLPA